jgi:hypothetical protein
MDQPQQLLWPDSFSLAGAGDAWSSADLNSFDLNTLPNVKIFHGMI